MKFYREYHIDEYSSWVIVKPISNVLKDKRPLLNTGSYHQKPTFISYQPALSAILSGDEIKKEWKERIFNRLRDQNRVTKGLVRYYPIDSEHY